MCWLFQTLRFIFHTPTHFLRIMLFLSSFLLRWLFHIFMWHFIHSLSIRRQQAVSSAGLMTDRKSRSRDYTDVKLLLVRCCFYISTSELFQSTVGYWFLPISLLDKRFTFFIQLKFAPLSSSSSIFSAKDLTLTNNISILFSSVKSLQISSMRQLLEMENMQNILVNSRQFWYARQIQSARFVVSLTCRNVMQGLCWLSIQRQLSTFRQPLTWEKGPLREQSLME